MTYENTKGDEIEIGILMTNRRDYKREKEQKKKKNGMIIERLSKKQKKEIGWKRRIN